MIFSKLILNPIFAASCSGKGVLSKSFLSFPTWYEYLPSTFDGNGVCSPQLTNLNDLWLIVAAVIEILLRIAAIMAVGFIIYGGFQYVTSQGSPDRTNAARNILTSAIIGLIICILAATFVAFLAGSFN